MRKINKWLWLGANINYENIFLDTRNLDTGKTSSYTINALPVMAAAKAAWFRRNHVFRFVEGGLGLQGILIAGMRFPF